MRFFLLLLLIVPLNCIGQLAPEQLAKVDSLNTVIRLSKNDTIVINALKAWDNIVYASDPEMDLKLNLQIDSVSARNLEQITDRTEREFFIRSKSFATSNLGFIYNERGENSTAMNYLNESLRLKKELKDEKAVARVLNNIGSIYHEQGVYSKAIEYYSKALSIHEKLGNKKEMAGALNNIGLIQRDQGNYETALKYYRRSLSLKLEIGDSVAIAVAYTNLGTLYNEMKLYDTARIETMKCLDISKKIGNKRYIALSYVNLGSIYHSLNQLDTALGYYLKGFAIQKEIDDGKMLAETAGYLSTVYLDMDNTAKAREYGEMALKLSYANDVVKVSEQASGALYRIYKKTGDNAKALEMFELNIKLKDSINSGENQKAVIRQQFRYEYEKQAALDKAEQLKKDELAAKDAERKNLIIWSGAGGLIMLLIFAGFVVNRLRVTRRQKAIIEDQKEKVDYAYSELGKEKQKSDKLLLNILPEEVAEELKTTGKSIPKHYEQVTVLFTDFKGFTKAARDISPYELVQTLNECFSAFDKIIEVHRMEKIKTIGDAYMCAGGVPIENTTNPADAVKAAIDMVAWINKWNKERSAKGLISWEIRIGIHTGELVAGVIGSKKFVYDVWGDAVNVASRMESYGEPGKINISAATNSFIKADFDTEFRGEIEIKNRGSVGMYFIKT